MRAGVEGKYLHAILMFAKCTTHLKETRLFHLPASCNSAPKLVQSIQILGKIHRDMTESSDQCEQLAVDRDLFETAVPMNKRTIIMLTTDCSLWT